MNDEALDYGDPSETAMQADDNGRGLNTKDDEELDAEMQDWAEQYDGDMDEFEQRREQRIQELRQAKSEVKFYPLPLEEGISAGANRGVTSRQIDLDDVDLLGPEEDLPPPEVPSLIGGGQDIRYSALHLSGPPVTQCSTSRLFAYVTHYGAQPLGLEWVNDSSCNIVFSDASAARLAIEYLCPATSTTYAPLIPLPNDQELDQAVHKKKRLDNPSEEEENSEWDEVFLQSLLFPRKAHRIPAKLYNAPERDAAAELREQQSDEKTSTLPEDAPEIYREMEAEDRKKRMLKPEQVNLQKLRGPLWLRWTSESLDVKASRAAKQSKWYQEHGNDAGKEVVTKLLDVGGVSDRLELLPSGNGNERQRMPKQRRDERDANESRGRGGRQAAMDEMDAEMDAWGSSEARLGGHEDERSNRRFLSASQYQNSRKGRGNQHGRMAMEALDEELEFNRRDRSASPTRQQHNYNHRADRGAGTSSVKVKGRGRMKAPSAWDDIDNAGGQSGMVADDYGHGSRRGGRGGQRGKWSNDSSLEQRMSQSLEQRLSGGNHLLDRMN